jgi:hypothetical protein
MRRARFPYAISNFKKLVEEGRLYADRTMFLEKLEAQDSSYHAFLRPRRFGKSLAISVMQYYYGKEHQKDFEALFGEYYIGQHPTPKANNYLVLKLDFSGILTDNLDIAFKSFTNKVKENILASLIPYKPYFPPEALTAIISGAAANEVLSAAIRLLEEYCPEDKIMVLIDEYDHFTNEIIAFNHDNFKEIVSQNGFVRKFYEVLKEGTQRGVVDRIFITGVSPVTLDSLTSGYNIGTNLTLDLGMHDFMGFTEAEALGFLRAAEVPEAELETVMANVRAWYNGYCFNQKAANRLYNPDMVLYFASHYGQYKEYPPTLLDANIASDYGKIRRMFRVGDEADNYAILEEIIENGEVQSEITRQYSFEKSWTRGDFVSLLFYLGLLTIKGADFDQLSFQVPNHVISELYYQYFQEVLLQQADMHADDMRVKERIIALARDNDIRPIAEALEAVLKRLDNRDARGFDEKYVKMALLTLLVPSGVYAVYSEYAIGQGYADVAMLRRPPILQPKHQHLIELKHLKKKDAARLEAEAEQGRAQLRRYLSHPDIARKGDVIGWLLVVVGYEVVIAEQVAPLA